MAADEDQIRNAKSRLRQAMEARRAAIALTERETRANALAGVVENLLAALPEQPASVSAFLSIGTEIDTAPLIARLTAKGLQLGLPVMVSKAAPLMFRTWHPGAPLDTVKWGIREPTQDAPVLVPEVLLVPLLAFDRRGGRLGYGGGFYDRTLAALRKESPWPAIGIAFDEQEVDAVPTSDYDERLDWVATPSGPIRCQP